MNKQILTEVSKMYLFTDSRKHLEILQKIKVFPTIILPVFIFCIFSQNLFAQDITPGSSAIVLRVRDAASPNRKSGDTAPKAKIAAPKRIKQPAAPVSKKAKPGSKPTKPNAYTAPETISLGVLNGKIDSLPVPPYPPAAKAVGAAGSVNVAIEVDENGDIVSAKAISGHPLLRQAAEEAARQTHFEPTTLKGVPVRIKGIIVYNFVK